MSDEIISFRFRDEAEVHLTASISASERWSGSFSATSMAGHIDRMPTTLETTYPVYAWKVAKIRSGQSRARVMRDTWLTNPYKSRLEPNGKLP
jgi:hypothetical protein